MLLKYYNLSFRLLDLMTRYVVGSARYATRPAVTVPLSHTKAIKTIDGTHIKLEGSLDADTSPHAPPSSTARVVATQNTHHFVAMIGYENIVFGMYDKSWVRCHHYSWLLRSKMIDDNLQMGINLEPKAKLSNYLRDVEPKPVLSCLVAE
jgi:hypothetical protein